jgi:cytochrome P450
VAVSEIPEALNRPACTPELPPKLPWPSAIQSLASVFFMERLVRYELRRFDGIARLHPLGVGEIVAVWDPALIRLVFTGDPEVLRAGEANARVVASAGSSSVLALDGEPHLRMRRLLSTPFHGGAVQTYRALVSEVTAAEVARWPVGEAFPIHPRMQRITLEVILRAVIGVRDPHRRERLRALLGKALEANQLAFMAEVASPGLAGSAVGRRMPWIRARREATALLYEEIAAHRADPDGRDDILAHLIAVRDDAGHGLTDTELHDQLLTLLSAGHESSATTLAWCFERVLRHPRVLARLRGELERDHNDAYLQAVINETLRTRPVLDAVWRKLAAPVELGRYTIPAGSTVVASIIGVQSSEAYADPDQFRPERFLDTPPPSYALIPFGGGTRRCAGASFATMEMKTVLRTVLERVELRAPTNRPERANRVRRFTTVPSRGARVIVTPRRA